MTIKSFLSKIVFIAFIISAFTSHSMAEDKKVQNVESAKQGQSLEASTATAEELYKISPSDIVLGDKKAKVTVIEYASMTCSHCADFHKNAYPEVKEKYIDTGKIKFVFRSFPLDEPALRASMLAYCSGPDRFYKFIDVMFTTQPNWALSKNYLEVLANIGKLGGVSGNEFDKCMANNVLEKKIMQGKFDATTTLSVRATPTFFINGNIYKGAHNFEYFAKVLDDALGEKPKDATAKTKDEIPTVGKDK